ncbi:MAG: TIGR02147 family protein [Oligoflexales bacterium]
MASSMTVFEFDDYKKYLKERLPTSGENRGSRSKLAKLLKCQSAHISQVLKGSGHFSLEHCAIIDEFLNHTLQESEYFLLLVHLGRSGSKKLSRFYMRRIDELKVLNRRANIAPSAKPLENEAALALYYSSWQVAAVHVALMKGPQRPSELAATLNLGVSFVKTALTNLTHCGMVEDRKDGYYHCVPQRLHLAPDSPFVTQHHLNWRTKLVQSLQQPEDKETLHYSGPMAISKRAASKIRALLVDSIERMEPIIASPGEDCCHAVCIDFFRFTVD